MTMMEVNVEYNINLTIENYNLVGATDEDNNEFRGILREILLSPESLSAITNIAESCGPDTMAAAISIMSDGIRRELIKTFGDIPEVKTIVAAIDAVTVAALMSGNR